MSDWLDEMKRLSEMKVGPDLQKICIFTSTGWIFTINADQCQEFWMWGRPADSGVGKIRVTGKIEFDFEVPDPALETPPRALTFGEWQDQLDKLMEGKGE